MIIEGKEQANPKEERQQMENIGIVMELFAILVVLIGISTRLGEIAQAVRGLHKPE